MNILTIENLSKTYGEKVLFDRISFGVAAGERVGLIGVNGTGKSTLLQIVSGRVEPDSGNVILRNGLTVEYLAQNPEFAAGVSVLEAIFAGDNPAMRAIRAYEQGLLDLAARPNDARAQTALADAQARMDQTSAWSLEAHAKAILTRLGVTDFARPVDLLSGGQRKRVAMARALIQPADLLILDEPTNHIDNDTIQWLEQYLARFNGALLLITHDRYFLDRVTNRIWELDRTKLHTYDGNYGAYLAIKAEREEMTAASEDKRQNLMRRELEWLHRGAKARSTKQKARIQRAETLIADNPDAPTGQVEIAIAGHRLGNRILELEHVTKRFGDRTPVQDFNYTAVKGDRVGIIGPNGSGKSTLLNMIAGRLEPDGGTVVQGQTVRLAYYTQESEFMDESQRVIDYAKDVAEVIKLPDGSTITASQMLERFLFPGRVQYTEIGKLSGGERRRLYLLKKLLEEPNVLLLDEPTNDLDIQTLTILEDFLDSFPGVVISVSHDRYFLDRVCDRLFAFEDGQIRDFHGDYSDYLERRQAEVAEREAAAKADEAAAKARTTAASSGGGVDAGATGAGAAKARKLTFKEQKEWETIEATIAQLEADLVALQQAMEAAATDYGRLGDLTQQQITKETALNAALDRWAALSELVEAIEAEKNRPGR